MARGYRAPVLAVTGASGRLARGALSFLLDRVPPGDVVAVTRDPDALADLAARGVRVRFGDLDRPAALVDAFCGVSRLLLVSTNDLARRAEQHAAALDAAITAGVDHVVYTSLGNPVVDNPTGIVTDAHRASEETLRRSGLAWTILRNAIYADPMVTRWSHAAVTGRLESSAGRGRAAFVARDDCAAVAATVLAGDGHDEAVYDVTGPELVGIDDVAAVVAETSGRPIELVDLDDEAMVRTFVARGLTEPMARIHVSFDAGVREGFFDQCTSMVRDLTGRSPRSVRDLLVEACAQAAR